MNFSEYASRVSLSRPLRPVTCNHCGATFKARDTRAKFCSNRCRSAARYARVKDAAKARQS